ncbi:MAG: hypothetical protein K5669_04560, partial [Lachnospiraceae bacterium]|nr:hypothetical protein [Lachnospiraceae bacterium]
LFACLLTFLLFPKFAFAGSVSKSASSFDSAWELYASSTDGKANMTYDEKYKSIGGRLIEL